MTRPREGAVALVFVWHLASPIHLSVRRTCKFFLQVTVAQGEFMSTEYCRSSPLRRLHSTSGREDLNLRSRRPKRRAFARLSYALCNCPTWIRTKTDGASKTPELPLLYGAQKPLQLSPQTPLGTANPIKNPCSGQGFEGHFPNNLPYGSAGSCPRGIRVPGRSVLVCGCLVVWVIEITSLFPC